MPTSSIRRSRISPRRTTVRSSPEPPSYPVPTITSQRIGKGVWRVDQGGTTVIEFSDHIVLYELGVNVATAKAVIAHARMLAPGKRVTHLITSHNHFDHTAGLRQAVAEGLTIVQRRGSEPQFRDMVAHAAAEFPDDLARAPKPLEFQAVDDHLRMSDDTQTLDIYWVRNNGHMADVLVGYIPSERLLMEGDLVTAAFDWQHWPDGFRDVVSQAQPQRGAHLARPWRGTSQRGGHADARSGGGPAEGRHRASARALQSRGREGELPSWMSGAEQVTTEHAPRGVRTKLD